MLIESIWYILLFLLFSWIFQTSTKVVFSHKLIPFNNNHKSSSSSNRFHLIFSAVKPSVTPSNRSCRSQTAPKARTCYKPCSSSTSKCRWGCIIRSIIKTRRLSRTSPLRSSRTSRQRNREYWSPSGRSLASLWGRYPSSTLNTQSRTVCQVYRTKTLIWSRIAASSTS